MKNRKRRIGKGKLRTAVKAAERKRDNSHIRDVSSKAVLGNAILCAQFLRDNVNVPVLKNITPDDIEDVSERYRPYLGVEFEPDTVKRIRVHSGGDNMGNEPLFLISLIEHKSLVDYDVSMQLLKYMMCIWMEYRREVEMQQEGLTRQKSFRYPMIIPVVYYEGKAGWTADTHLRGRISGGNALAKWIPDFKYEVVRIHDYSNAELLERKDEMSLIMLINKIQDAADLSEFNRLPHHEVDRIIRDSPGSVIDVIASVIEGLCIKIGATEEETRQCVKKVKERKMGYLFENMEKMDIQEERRNTQEAVKKLNSTTQKLNDTTQKLSDTTQKLNDITHKLNKTEKEKEEIAENGIRTVIEICQEMGMSKEETCSKVIKKFREAYDKQSENEIKVYFEAKINEYWK